MGLVISVNTIFNGKEGCYLLDSFFCLRLVSFALFQVYIEHLDVCKVEFYQPSCWLYSVPNLLVF